MCDLITKSIWNLKDAVVKRSYITANPCLGKKLLQTILLICTATDETHPVYVGQNLFLLNFEMREFEVVLVVT